MNKLAFVISLVDFVGLVGTAAWTVLKLGKDFGRLAVLTVVVADDS